MQFLNFPLEAKLLVSSEKILALIYFCQMKIPGQVKTLYKEPFV